MFNRYIFKFNYFALHTKFKFYIKMIVFNLRGKIYSSENQTHSLICSNLITIKFGINHYNVLLFIY